MSKNERWKTLPRDSKGHFQSPTGIDNLAQERFIRQIINLYEAGWSMAEVGRFVDRHHSTIRGYLKRYAPEVMRPRTSSFQKLPNSEFDRTRYLYEQEEMSIAEIAQHMGVTRNAILYRLRRAMYHKRSRSEANRLALAKRKVIRNQYGSFRKADA